MNRIQEIRILHRRLIEYTQVWIVRQITDAFYPNPSRHSLNRLEEIINALVDRWEGELELRLYPDRVEAIYTLPLDYYDGPLELPDFLG